MSKAEVCVFVTQMEFDSLCDRRIDDARDKLYQTLLTLREENPNYSNVAEMLNKIMLDISRVKIDVELIAKKMEVAQ